MNTTFMVRRSAHPLKRLRATILTDFRLQYRNGFYYAVIFVVAVLALAVSQFQNLDLAWLMPVLVISNLVLNTFYFIGGLVLLEKGEGTLHAQVVTPLRTGEYLAAKLITLTSVSLIENTVIVALLAGLGFQAVALTAGIVLASVLYCLFGFAFVARYDSINEFLFPSILYVTLLLLPLLDYLGIWPSWLFYLHPMQAALLLLRAAFGPIEAWQWLYAVGYGLVWAAGAYVICRRAFDRHVIAREGVR
jgi:fluoroquinolone transport system permease protein